LQGAEQLSTALNMIVNNVSFVSINGEICENYFGLLQHKEREIQESIDSAGVAIQCDNISFAYDKTGNALNSISLSIKQNEIVALVGYNGSGKTTLSKILLNIYKPSAGIVQYNWEGKTRSNSNLPKRSALYQDFCIYKDMSIYENVSISMPEKNDDNRTEKLISRMGLSSSTLIGNEFGGIELSSGQSQKVAFARCLNSPSGLVLLDEPLSHLDPYAEYNLIKQFIETFSMSTRIFTTHRLSCTKLADRILVMDKGTIVEEGKHDILMQKKGKYYELFNAQAELYR
jgi:ATP-binding cassette subfamily B protein